MTQWTVCCLVMVYVVKNRLCVCMLTVGLRFCVCRVMVHIVAQCHEEGLEHYLRSYVKVKYGRFSFSYTVCNSTFCNTPYFGLFHVTSCAMFALFLGLSPAVRV